MIALSVKVLAEERAEAGGFLLPALGEAAVAFVFVAAGLTLITVAALRQRRDAGAVSIGLSALFSLSLCAPLVNAPSHRADVAALALSMGLAVSLLTSFRQRGPDTTRLAAIIGIWCVNVTACCAAARAWEPLYSARGLPVPFRQVLFLSTGLLWIGPAVAWLAGRRTA